jgi:acyl carrier protein
MLDRAEVPLTLSLKHLIFQELKIMHVKPEEFSDDEPIFSDRLGLDSIDAVEIVYLVEKHFDVSIKDMKVARPALQSINTLAAFIETGAV